MAKIIHTHLITPDKVSLWEQDQIYNGLDCCVTLEVFTQLKDKLDTVSAKTYAFSKALQAPVLEMGMRGIKVDAARTSLVIDEYTDLIDKLERQLDRIVLDGVGMFSFNWRSNADLKKLFYIRLGIPEVKSKGRVTVDRKALEKIGRYTVAKQIVAHILLMRDIGKKIGVLRTAADDDGYIRTTYNIAGTITGRFSSSLNEFGTGGNMQNVEESLRSVFVADKGMKFAKFDAKSGESFCVGAIEWNQFRDPRYLDVCESGDPHTAVARICWPQLPWTGDLEYDKEHIAEKPFYRHYTYRFMCKKLGHGSNYGGEPPTLAAQANLPEEVVRKFQPIYFEAFPAHRKWQLGVKEQIRSKGFIVSLTGRRRWFFGRRNDPDTIREAIAYDPQCSLADIVNKAMLKIWRENITQIVAQDHDAITFQYPEEIEDEIIPILFDLLIVPIPLAAGRTLRIPYDCVVGWNRGKWHPEKNPDGFKEYKGTDKRKRQPEVGILDRRFSRKYK